MNLVRSILLVGASFFALGSECDFTQLVDALCTHAPDRPECPRESVVFVTSTTHTGDLGGLVGADAICQARAQASPLAGRTFVAWLSTSTVDARDRLVEPEAPGFVRPDGGLVATSIADLTDGTLAMFIDLDENGSSVGNAFVFTGTRADGTLHFAARTCADWTVGSAGSGLVGRASSLSSSWTIIVNSSCTTPRRLYCFEI